MIRPGLESEQSAALLEHLVELNVDGMFAFDREFRYVLWNQTMEEIFGVEARAVLGRSAFEVFPFLVETGEDRLFGEALQGRSATSTDRPFTVPGTDRSGYYEAHYWPWRAGGEVVGGLAVVRDVTVANRITQAAVETEARFQNMADAAPVLLWMSRVDGLCTFFNQTWLDFTGRPLEEEWGAGWAEGVHFEDFERCMETYLTAFAAREQFEMEYRLRRADGQYRWILDRGTPRYTPEGGFAGYIGSCVDITERRQLEEELRQAIQARDVFLSIASHELRTPLTSMQLQVERVLRALGKQPDPSGQSRRLVEQVGMALDQTLRLGSLVNVLLDVSRIVSGQLVLEHQDTDFARLVEDLLQRLQSTAQDAGCTVALDVQGDTTGRWDRLRLEQVITNLVSNAMKYGAGKPVELVVRGLDDELTVSVKDHGIGIAPEHHAGVFERFSRFVAQEHYGGFGLGLWISREIVHAHGGTIAVASDVGAGATFLVTLPRRRPGTSATADRREEEAAAHAAEG